MLPAAQLVQQAITRKKKGARTNCYHRLFPMAPSHCPLNGPWQAAHTMHAAHACRCLACSPVDMGSAGNTWGKRAGLGGWGLFREIAERSRKNKGGGAEGDCDVGGAGAGGIGRDEACDPFRPCNLDCGGCSRAKCDRHRSCTATAAVSSWSRRSAPVLHCVLHLFVTLCMTLVAAGPVRVHAVHEWHALCIWGLAITHCLAFLQRSCYCRRYAYAAAEGRCP
jgi:hypothetical protein